MSKYIFIDNWVLGRLSNDEFRDSLVSYITSNHLVVILNSLSLTELYNPNWQDGDRAEIAVDFYSILPCVIVDPAKVKQAEIDNNLNKLENLPIEMDLRNIEESERKLLLLDALRGGALTIEQGINIPEWDKGYKKEKSHWLGNVDNIIANAINNGTLKKTKKKKDPVEKETFLLSLDMREVISSKFDLVFNYRLAKRNSTDPSSGVRFTSLLFWHLYIDEDPSNKIKHGGSDIGDIHQMSLIPYCDVFTLDKAMFRLVGKVKSDCQSLDCRLLTKKSLESEIYSFCSKMA